MTAMGYPLREMAPSLTATWLETMRALSAPRRAVSIGVVVAALLAAQAWFRADLYSILSAVAVASLFLAVSPAAWRVLFPDGEITRFDRLAAYGLFASTPAVLSLALRDIGGVGDTLLTDGVNVVVIVALSSVGGFGLARDIQLERGLAAERARADELSAQAERAELLALRAHLDPHFLFNTLQALAEWTREDPATAERGLLRLADLMRDVMWGVRDGSWSLQREIEVARAVWELYSLRDPERFVHEIHVDDALPGIEVPPLVLLPIVENAVKHGPGAGHTGTMELRVEARADRLAAEVRVENPGEYGGPREGGQGLVLARKRLAQMHGQGARVDIVGAAGRTTVTMTFPAPETT